MAKENKKEEVKAIVEAVALTPLRYNDVRYEIGDKLELTEAEFEIFSKNYYFKMFFYIFLPNFYSIFRSLIHFIPWFCFKELMSNDG